MLNTYYFAIVLGVVGLTAAWLFRPQERTAVTTLTAFLGWSWAALVGGSVERVDRTEQIVEHNDETFVVGVDELTAAPIPDEIRILMGLFAALSALALILNVWGVYPPDDEHSQS